MTGFSTSADGTRIAFQREGNGPAIILVGSANQFRAFDTGTAEVARMLAENGFTAITFDRRGRGESMDTLPFDVDREVDDIRALLDVAGGSAALYGSSSGAVLCLWAAAVLPGATRLVLWEPPLDLESDGSENLAGLEERLAAGDREGAVAFFMRDMPRQWFEGAKNSPAWPTLLSIAHTLAYDAAVLEKAERGATLPGEWGSIAVPTIVLLGEETQPIFPPAADAIVGALPNASQRRIDARNHGWAPEVMAREITEFLTA
ncbi:alpha/beta fold hydrolase [Mycetocola miduiensis]|uniref:Pimeloyl-ACP methyl ester carboxylesterase n=1 Tax=Mycetocola miduiensis TaxID=995034 RepID=A0A1I5AAX7_9MICO|nr:alpha/beta hydrolase [Mycetocola miduiensis]SFN59634.1 Pimeloyl-ACP methyl ester carboxylesterase [Mycetocola miduiensis]